MSENAKPGVQFKTVAEEHEGQRIDNYLMRELKGLPKSKIYSLLRQGQIRVDGKRAKPDARVEPGQVIRIPPLRLDEAAPVAAPSKQLSSLLADRVVFEDKGLIVINKPSGLAVHGGSGVNLGLIEALRAIRPTEKSLELVHRLDKETSGLLMIAKKRSVLKDLHEQMRSGSMFKSYVALLAGTWRGKNHRIEAPLYKFVAANGERFVRVDKNGKEARTDFVTLKNFKQATLVEAILFTGRTHQIRVHSQFAGHAIIGDEKYGDEMVNKQFRALGLNRLFLHSAKLEIDYNGKRQRFEAPLDQDLAGFIRTLE
ncbi:MAG TPA: RluA family pseudouridine synthase [Pseudomonadales bacterium]|nr:RluA family pseudouridine synthase [Pseudomonadales bacterium]